MKKTALFLSILLGMPLLASANPGPAGHFQIGERDKHGNYWDGYQWRQPAWWKNHHGRNVGLKGPHGYWNGNGWQAQPPGKHAPMKPHEDKAPPRH